MDYFNVERMIIYLKQAFYVHIDTQSDKISRFLIHIK